MAVLVIDLDGNPNIGLYGFATDKYVLLSKDFPESIAKKIEETLGVKSYYIGIAGTELIGAFLNGNDKCLLVPDIAFDTEIEAIKKTGIPFKIIKTKLTCLGNNLLIGEKGVIANPEFPDTDIAQIQEALGIPVARKKILNVNAVGSLALRNKSKMVMHHDLIEQDGEFIGRILGASISPGTVNMGNPFVRSGVINNSKGFIVGRASGGPEISNIEQELGYLD